MSAAGSCGGCEGQVEAGPGERLRWLEAETRRHFGVPAGTPVVLAPIRKGGSDRTFHRVECPEAPPLIVMHYGTEREENRFFVPIARYLGDIGMPVPRVLAFDEAERLVWMEDLGDRDLHAIGLRAWAERRPLYRRAIEAIAVLHGRDWGEPAARGVKLCPGFDGKLYRWEHGYFLENFVQRVCGIPAAEAAAALHGELDGIAEELLGTRTVLVHRDFQSQNLLVQDRRVFFIDFQGMRPGSAYYDLGSLLYDPYVPISREEREEMLCAYGEVAGADLGSWEEYRRRFHLAACQRLMQALGAFGFLGLAKGKRSFLGHVPRGIGRLIEAADAAGGLPRLRALAERCRDAAGRNGLMDATPEVM